MQPQNRQNAPQLGPQRPLPSTLPWLVVGAAIGAGLMYIFDPQQGRRRRALLRDQGLHWQREALERSGRKSRHWRNVAQGWMHDLGFGAEAAGSSETIH